MNATSKYEQPTFVSFVYVLAWLALAAAFVVGLICMNSSRTDGAGGVILYLLCSAFSFGIVGFGLELLSKILFELQMTRALLEQADKATQKAPVTNEPPV